MMAVLLGAAERLEILERENESLRQRNAKLQSECAYYNACLQNQVSSEDFVDIHVIHAGRLGDNLKVQMKVYFTYEQIFSDFEMFRSRIPVKEILIQDLSSAIMSCVRNAMKREQTGMLKRGE